MNRTSGDGDKAEQVTSLAALARTTQLNKDDRLGLTVRVVKTDPVRFHFEGLRKLLPFEEERRRQKEWIARVRKLRRRMVEVKRSKGSRANRRRA
jgi:hypothetical protein